MSSSHPRIILIGASNLTRAISTVTQVARGLVCDGGPAAFTITYGHGRSYGQTSHLLGRSLPGVLRCGMWDALNAQTHDASVPTYALITDIGNDIVYGVKTAQLMSWIHSCIERLRDLNARIVVTELPEQSIDRVTPRRYEIVRRIFFARHHTSYEQVMTVAREVAAEVRSLGSHPGVSVAPQQGAWYGADPIHIKTSCWCDAWTSILRRWHDGETNDERGDGDRLAHASPGRVLYLRTRVPHTRGIFGWTQTAEQPCGRFRDGSSVSLY